MFSFQGSNAPLFLGERFYHSTAERSLSTSSLALPLLPDFNCVGRSGHGLSDPERACSSWLQHQSAAQDSIESFLCWRQDVSYHGTISSVNRHFCEFFRFQGDPLSVWNTVVQEVFSCAEDLPCIHP